MKYYLGPWVWVEEEESYWRGPIGTVGLIDLRTIAQSAQATTPSGVGFFAVDGADLGVDYTFLGEGYISSVAVDDSVKDAWETHTGYRPNGLTLLDLLWDQLTTGSDPAGLTTCCPLMPTTKGQLELHLGGHSLVRSEAFVYGVHPHTTKVRDVLRINYRKIREDAVRNGSQHHRKVLDMWGEKYGVDRPQNEFIPDDLPRETRLPHETTIGDTFTDTDSTDLSAHTATGPNGGFSWTEITGDADIISNTAEIQTTGGTSVYMRADSDLSSDDHYSQVIANINSGSGLQSSKRVIIRKDSTATLTLYFMDISVTTTASGNIRLFRIVASTATQIGSNVGFTQSLPHTLYLEADGSSLITKVDGVTRHTETDTNITGNLRAGIAGRHEAAWDGDPTGNGKVALDNFEAADLGAAPVTTGIMTTRTSFWGDL